MIHSDPLSVRRRRYIFCLVGSARMSLRGLLGVSIPPPSLQNRSGDDNLHPPPFEDTRDRAEELFNSVMGSNFEQTDEWVPLCLVQMGLVLILDCVSAAEQSLQDLNKVQWVASQPGVLPASLHIIAGLIT